MTPDRTREEGGGERRGEEGERGEERGRERREREREREMLGVWYMGVRTFVDSRETVGGRVQKGNSWRGMTNIRVE